MWLQVCFESRNVRDRRRSTGRLFQARVPATARARSPMVERCVAVVTLYTLPRDRSSSRADVSRGGAPIGAGGSLFSSLLFSYASPRLSPLGVGSWPPTFRGKGGRGTKFGNNSYITYCSYHAFTLTSTLCRLYPGVWRITLSTIFRLAACRQRNNSNIAVQGNEDYLLTRVSFLFLGFKIVSRSLSTYQMCLF